MLNSEVFQVRRDFLELPSYCPPNQPNYNYRIPGSTSFLKSGTQADLDIVNRSLWAAGRYGWLRYYSGGDYLSQRTCPLVSGSGFWFRSTGASLAACRRQLANHPVFFTLR